MGEGRGERGEQEQVVELGIQQFGGGSEALCFPFPRMRGKVPKADGGKP